MAGVVIRVWSDLPYCIPVTDHCSLRKPGCGQIISGILTGGSDNSRNLATRVGQKHGLTEAGVKSR